MRYWNIMGCFWIACMGLFWFIDAAEPSVGIAAILATQCLVTGEILEAIQKRGRE